MFISKRDFSVSSDVLVEEPDKVLGGASLADSTSLPFPDARSWESETYGRLSSFSLSSSSKTSQVRLSGSTIVSF